MRKEVLRLEHVSKRMDGECLLSDINLSVYNAAFHCVLMPNSRSRTCLHNILRGVLSVDSGHIYVNDMIVTAQQLRRGEIGCVSDKSALISQMSIAENIFLTDNRFFLHGFKKLKLMISSARQILNELGIRHLSAVQEAGLLKPYEAHVIEIVNDIFKGARIIYLSNIAEKYTDLEMSDLKQVISHLNETGIAVIMVSAKYNPLFDNAQFTSIIDNGSTVITLPSPYNGRDQIHKYLHIPEATVIKKYNTVTKQVFRLQGKEPYLKDIDITVHREEIVGFHDADWSIIDNLLDVVTGRCKSSASLYINEKPTVISSLQSAIANGIAIIRDVKSSNKLFYNMSLSKNITVNMGAPLYNRYGFRSSAVEKYATQQSLQILGCSYLLDHYGKLKYLPHLPRNEQMKIVVARWLCQNPLVFIFINPLISYDDATVHEFYLLLEILKEQGYGVLIVSSSLNELRLVTSNYGG